MRARAQVVRRQLDRDLVAGQDADVVHAHLSGDVPEHDMAVFQLHTERGVGEILENLALHLNDIVFRHAFRVGRPSFDLQSVERTSSLSSP